MSANKATNGQVELLSALNSMSHTQARANCRSEASNVQGTAQALEKETTSEHKDTFLQRSTDISACLHISDEKKSTLHQPSSRKDFDMALKLFPEFLSGHGHKDCVQAKKINSGKVLSNNEGSNNITQHLDNSKDIVEWIKDEYGM